MTEAGTQVYSRVVHWFEVVFGVFGGVVAIATLLDWLHHGKVRLILVALAVVLFLLALVSAFYLVKTDDNRRAAPRMAALVVLATVGVAGATLLVNHSDAGTRGNLDPVTATSPIAPTRATSFPTPSSVSFGITTPAEKEKVNAVFTVAGTTPNLGEDRLWLTDYAYDATGTRAYYRKGATPISVQGTDWLTQDGPIGSPLDPTNLYYTITVVRANPRCSAAILAVKPNVAGDVIIGAILPQGCSVAGRVHVLLSS